ncbi:MAG: general secretion pathway protein GspB [Pelobacteraceae bacterium]
MSSILKALKKLENERAIRQPDALKIDSDILRPDPPSGNSGIGKILVALLLIAGGAGATYLLMARNLSPEKNGAARTRLAATSSQTATPRPVLPPAQIPAEIPPPAIVTVPAQPLKPERVVTPPRKATTPTQAVKTNQRGKDAPTHKPVTAVTQKTAAPSNKPVPEAAQKPAIRVNGIAWQNSSADSMAIINGVAVSNGKVIEGVEVEEIQKDRVRFSYHGEKFEIPLGQSNR